jgi:hypothetical protein
MTANEALDQMGKPRRTARQILYRRYREQWFYDAPAGAWIEFDCFKGQEPRLIAKYISNSVRQ